MYVAVVLCAGLLFFGGCKDLFHPKAPDEEPTQEESNPKQYTVSYKANGANGTPPAVQTVSAGRSVTLAGKGGLIYTNYTFSGWNISADGTGTPYKAGGSYTPTASVTLYAQWTPDLSDNPDLPDNPDLFDNLSLNDSLTWISDNAVEGGSYSIVVKKNETIPPRTLYYDGKTVTVILKGDTTERTVKQTSTGILFAIESGATLTLDNNITLQGQNPNTDSLVQVNSGGTLVMNTGSKIRDNTSSASTSSSSSSYTYTYSYGGGVFVDGGTFTMSGGTISGNTSTATSYSTSSYTRSYGGGVYVGSGTFTMSGGTISGNTSTTSYGGGVGVGGGTFTMSGGTISSNTASYGGGVDGGLGGGTFTMSGGTISGNTAASYGGGVYAGSGRFIKQSGGIIYGDTNTTHTTGSTENTASSGYGHAVYVSSTQIRNTTAGVGVTLDSTKSISEGGGWE
jgi:uncharacterized repeat protein (TIGR02543 family)